MPILKGFKDFLMRGNVVDLAVAVVIGTAFGALVKTFVDLMMSLVGKMGGQPDFSRWKPYDLPLGAFVTALVSFLIVAASVYFVVVRPLNKLAQRRARGVEPGTAAPSEEVALLTEIRDSLRARD